MVKDFYELEIHENSLETVELVYDLVCYFPEDEKYITVAQLKRAAHSIGANIAEGWGRYHYKDRIRFLYQARGSLYEVKHFLRAAERLGFIEDCDEVLLKDLFDKLESEGVKINNAISSLYNALDKK